MPSAPPRTAARPDTEACEPRNFWAWVLYQCFYRIGWQFKMESTMVAGLISYLTPDRRVMGLFTTINSLGRQAAPFFAAPQVDTWASKRNCLLLFWGFTVLCWAGLAGFLWLPAAQNKTLTLWVFGFAYTLFFVWLGASSVAQGALLGKIIPATMRGRAMAVGTQFSGVINVAAILLIYYVLRQGYFAPPLNYALAFSITVFCFMLAAGALLAIRETPSEPIHRGLSVANSFRYIRRLTAENRNLRLLMVVNLSVALGGSMLQFYTGFWRATYPGHFPEHALVLATVVQVLAQSVSSAIVGQIADRRGNRILICGLLWLEAAVPLSALFFGGLPQFQGTWWFLGVYTLVGLRFPLYQLLVNYLLEILPQEEHAMGIGATNTIQIITAPSALVLGEIAQRFGYGISFVVASAAIVVAALVALRLEEPRFAS